MSRKGKKGRERGRRRKKMRQKEEEYDEIFKRYKLVERSPSKREEKKNGRGDRTNELIIILKELKNDLKQEIAELRKEIKEMKEECVTSAALEHVINNYHDRSIPLSILYST